MLPGDVVFTIKQSAHKIFKRIGNNLFMDCEISLEEALLGFNKKYNHLDGHSFEVSSKEGNVIQPFSWIILKGEGMPHKNYPSEFGDLHVKMIVKLPKYLTDEQAVLFGEIFSE